jgi:uncharacterized protein (DUF1778 family)
MTTRTTTRKKPTTKARTRASGKAGSKAPVKARLEARIDTELDQLITEAAEKQGVSKTAFVSDAARDAALKVIARTDVTLMSAEVFDQMMASIDIADDSPELQELAALPRRITT